MSRNSRVLIPQAKAGLDSFKIEVANEIGIANYNGIDKGDLTSRQNGSVGGFMVKHMVESWEKDHTM